MHPARRTYDSPHINIPNTQVRCQYVCRKQPLPILSKPGCAHHRLRRAPFITDGDPSVIKQSSRWFILCANAVCYLLFDPILIAAKRFRKFLNFNPDAAISVLIQYKLIAVGPIIMQKIIQISFQKQLVIFMVIKIRNFIIHGSQFFTIASVFTLPAVAKQPFRHGATCSDWCLNIGWFRGVFCMVLGNISSAWYTYYLFYCLNPVCQWDQVNISQLLLYNTWPSDRVEVHCLNPLDLF